MTGPAHVRSRAVAVDGACLVVLTIASALPYLAHIGFYSDDWRLLADFQSADAQGSPAGLVAQNFAARPVQGVYLALLFKLFGLQPLGYHCVNAAVIAASLCLFYLLLLRLHVGRAQALAAALLFLVLPQLSTVRVWYAAFQIPLSLGLMLASLHCQLSFFRSRRTVSLVLAVLAALLSIAAYEIFAPLLAGFAAALAFLGWRTGRAGPKSSRAALIAAASLIPLIVAAIAYKVVVSGRTGPIGDAERYLAGLRQLVRPDYDWRTDSSLNVFAALRAEFWAPIRGWFTAASSILGGEVTALVLVLALMIAAVAWWRISSAANELRRPAAMRLRLLLLGVAAFLLGHAAFLIVPWITFSSTGIDNRMHVAAALGVAMVLASAISLAAGLVPARHRGAALGATVALIAALGFIRLSQVERYWAEARALQARVLAAAKSDLRALPPHSTVILDGICPYHGPAIVFETDWDVSGGLSLELGRPMLGDVVSDRMQVTEKGLKTSMYEEPKFYAFGPGLYVYDPVKHQLVQLGGAGVARRYFQSRRAPKCPPAFLGRGVAV